MQAKPQADAARRRLASFRAPAIIQRPMSCTSTSGGDGHGTHSRPERVRPRFYPSGASSDEVAADVEASVLVEAESSDLSEQQFAASLESSSPQLRPRFIPGPPGNHPPLPGAHRESATPAEAGIRDDTATSCDSEENNAPPFAREADDYPLSGGQSPAADEGAVETPNVCSQSAPEAAAGRALSDGSDELLPEGPQWRQEVAARLHNYHSRRTRKPPRYPSLALKFDPPVYSSVPTSSPEPPRAAACAPPSRTEAATAAATVPEELEEPPVLEADANNIIEFPRPLVPPPPRPDELAESMLDLPRILDAPEAVSKQVPLGGIILQPEEASAASDLELPLQVASLGRRMLAAGLDGALVGTATLMFAAIVDKMATLLPSLHVLLGLGVALPAILWAVFQYVFLVYTASTPGMRLTGLRLSDFDGSAPGRSTRRWRALAMALSAVSLGLGFLWCLLDEDTLCWHDRITRTYLNAGPSPAAGARPGPLFPQRFFNCLRRVEAFLRRREEEISQEPPDWR